MASRLFKKEIRALESTFEAASSSVSHPRPLFSPNHAPPGLYVFSRVRWSWNSHHAAHSSADTQFGKALVFVQSHVGNTSGPGVVRGGLVYRSGAAVV